MPRKLCNGYQQPLSLTLAEGTGPAVAERYELAGSMSIFVDGLLQFFKKSPA
jgi:hypothetical protein